MPNNTIAIVGGGMVGLACAAVLAPAGFTIHIVENNSLTLTQNKTSWQAQVSAINHASQKFLQNIHVWDLIPNNKITALQKMLVWDHLGGGEITFAASDIRATELAFIIDNQALIKALQEYLTASDNVIFHVPNNPINIIKNKESIQLVLANDTIVQTDLIIGADGVNSWVRTQMNVVAQEYDYFQDALIGVVKSELTANKTAYQNFLSQGPLGLLPLYDDLHHVFIWSTDSQHAEKLQALPSEKFNHKITQALEKKLGALHLISDIKKIPLKMRHAKQYVLSNMALIGDAAHNIHPLAGQGVNLGLMDAACLATVLIDAKQSGKLIGDFIVLRKYERWRKGYNQSMITGMRLFKEIFTSQSIPIVSLRSLGLKTTNRFAFLKKWVVQHASGIHDDLPSIVK